jgi:N-acetyl-anhydromuramyl-L-alanine amidase AmpD
MSRRGFPDIGYHFVIAPDGVVYEGVPLLAVGSHVKNANTGRIGIALVVNSDVEPLSGAAWDALLAVFEWIKGQIRTIESVKAHRDFPTVNTSCPGRFLYARMDEIRALWGLAKSRDK